MTDNEERPSRFPWPPVIFVAAAALAVLLHVVWPLPWFGAPMTMARICTRRAASGWVPNDIAPLYVTRGLGEQLPLPLRINCPPEILVVRLRSAQHPE